MAIVRHIRNRKSLIINGKGGPVRKINLEKENVSTLLTNGQGGFNNMQYMSFDATGDTLFISDDHGQNNKDRREIAYILRSEEFGKLILMFMTAQDITMFTAP